MDLKYDSMLLSVIVPIYLKPPIFLRECIESILRQSFRDFELILVNDASPDYSLDTLRYYADKDYRIKIINLEKNYGVAAARNRGLSVAQGKYIFFIDSDDIIASDYFQTLLSVAEHFGLEIVASGVTDFQTTLNAIPPVDLDKIFQLKTIPYRTPMVQHFICRIFLRSTIQHLHFDEKLHSGEDVLFIHQAMLIAKRCAEIDYKGYCYRHAPEAKLEAYRQQFCSMKQTNEEKLLQHMEGSLYLIRQLCGLKKFGKNHLDIQFVCYFSVRRFLRHSNSIWKLSSREEQIFYWQKFCEVFKNNIQPQLLHSNLNLFLYLIFKHKKPFLGIRSIIYGARIFCEVYYIKENIRRFLNPIKLYFRGIAC
ncbi:MAG: glycosyltransferase [Puniceicoccales bacterium]|jgi:glycosyltransferase involved in cell wall biosynthesis|nr:glycosyltransferase [Puniceicoccales bacterium]